MTMKNPSLFLLLLVTLTGHTKAAESSHHWQSATSAPTVSPPPPVAPENKQSLATTPLPLPSAALRYAQEQATPLTGAEIEQLGRAADAANRGRAYQARVTVPRISTLTVNLSPGASVPILRTAADQTSSVTFSDSTGPPVSV